MQKKVKKKKRKEKPTGVWSRYFANKNSNSNNNKTSVLPSETNPN